MTDLVERVTGPINIGDRISVFASSKNAPSSAHLIHRNPGTSAPDYGALVLAPDSDSPTYLLFAFDGATF